VPQTGRSGAPARRTASPTGQLTGRAPAALIRRPAAPATRTRLGEVCGICGVVSASGRVDRDRLDAMSATLVHRGPDAEGAFVDVGVGLAARRLAIIDLPGGDQPISNEDGSCTVVQNGEIYNYGELTRELQSLGHRFRTRSDTEVLVHAYEEWGLRFPERLRGMFAVALWDSTRRRLVLARDRFGIKPLYYRDADGELAFASELDALPRGEIDLDALEAFLAFNSIPAPLSIFREIRKLPAGQVLTWEDGRVELRQYARPGPLDVRRGGDEAELVEECRARLADSVRAHLVADVPVGVLLSGGVDSGALAALAARESVEPVRTFSIGFEEASFDELAGARAVAWRYGTRHRELVLRPDAALLLPALAAAFDEPFADSSALPTYLVAKLAAEDVKVALSGEGGDELFGGYYTYVADLAAERLGGLATAARPLVERLPSSSRKASFDYKAKRFVRSAHLPPLERHHGWKEIFSADARAELVGRRHSFDPVSLLRARFAETEGHGLLPRLQDVDLGIYLADDLLVKTDRASMAWSLEARVPFLDPVVTNFAFSLPPGQKVRRLAKKRLLRKAMEPLLPREVVHGRKRGFSIPAAAWLRGELEPFARETLSAETLRRQGFFSPAAVARVLEDHVAGREDLSRQVWGLLAFTLWHEHHVEGVRRDSSLAGALA
jgi:asparagine synthase (glutamine-hydrolysing)